MEKQYCVSCGAVTTKGDSFCFTCGAKIDEKKVKSDSYSTSLYAEDEAVLTRPQQQRPKRSRGRSKNRRSRRIATAIILSVVLIPIITMTSISSIRYELGSLDYEIPDMGITNANLDIYNDIGSITIYYDDSISNLFEAEIVVRGGLRASIDDAANFNHTITNDTVDIDFTYTNPIGTYWDMKSLNHDIVIYLNPIVAVSINAESGTGSVNCYVEELTNVVINDLHLASSTGSVDFYAYGMHNLSLGDVQLESSTGSIDFDLGDSTNTTITKFEIACSTGSIDVFLGTYTLLDCSVIDISTSTGSIDVMYTDIITTQDITWLVSTSTGSIDFFIEQTLAHQENVTMNYLLDTSTGSIDVYCEINDQIGIEMEADTSTGSINLPNGYSYYLSTEFALKNSQYTFVMNTSTGSITASVIN